MCRALQAEGLEVVIVTTDEGFPTQLHNTSPGNLDEIPTFFFPVQLGASFKYSRPLSSWLDANVKNFDVVHIHAIFNHACISAARICRKYGVPYVVRPLGTLDPWSMKQKPVRKALFWRLGGKRMMEAAAAVHYTAQAEKEATERSLGLNHGTVVPLGVAVAQPVAIQNDGATYPYILVLSRLHPKKGLDILIDAFVAVVRQRRFKQWRLVLSGDGPVDYVESLKRQVAAHYADDSILFTGWLEGDQHQATLSNAALLTLPSYQENFGMCVMEAMSCGVPVVVSPQVNLAAEVESAGAGWIVPVERNAIQTTLEEAFLSEAERRKRGAAGKVLSERFAWPKVARQLVDLYSTVLNSEPGAVATGSNDQSRGKSQATIS
jgi:glycosyltransferase involved in cell wall biosynthesis